MNKEYKKYPDENSFTVIGRITSEPVFKKVNETGVFEFSIANNRPRKNDENFVNFFKVKKWGKTVENLAKVFHKGTKVYVRGSLDIDKWEKEGVQKQSVSIFAEKIEKFADSRSFSEGNHSSVSEGGIYQPDSVTEIMSQAQDQEIDDMDAPL